MAARSVYTLSRWKQWQYTLKTWLPGVLTGLFGVVPSFICFASPQSMKWQT